MKNFQKADTELVFTNRNKALRVELPNRKIIKAIVNFSSDVLSVVRDLCYLCEIRYHTELSLIRSSQVSLKNQEFVITIFFEISIFLSHDHFKQNDGLESLVAGASPVIHLDQTQPVYSTLRAPGRHGSKNEVLNSGTRLENVEYKKLSAPGSQLDPEKLNPPKVGFLIAT